jgi:hypothetical protein
VPDWSPRHPYAQTEEKEQIPAGIKYVLNNNLADNLRPRCKNNGRTAWVVDTGIKRHPDLNIDLDKSRSFLDFGDPKDWSDRNGHGT